MDHFSELQKQQMREVIDNVMDFLEKTRACFEVARNRIIAMKREPRFPLNYSPNEIMQMNLWERESYRTETEIKEMELLLKSFPDNLSIYQKGMKQWIAALQERSTSIIPLIQRR